MTTVTAEPRAQEVLTPSRPRRRGRAGWRTVRYAILLFSLVLVLIPVYVLFVTSFKGIGDAAPSRTWFLPTTWTVENWVDAWEALSPPWLWSCPRRSSPRCSAR